MLFQSIYQMIAPGTDLSINIRKVENRLSVAVMPKRTSLKDEAQQIMVPLILNGTPEELDTQFLQAVTTPVQKAQGVLTNLETFEKQAEQMALQSRTAKSAAEKEPKETREKREKMEKLLKKAGEAITGKRYSEALTWLKQAKVLAIAEKQKEIEAKMQEVQKKASEGSLFTEDESQPQQDPIMQGQSPINGNPLKYKPGEQIPMFTTQPVQQTVSQPQQQPTQPQQTTPQPYPDGTWQAVQKPFMQIQYPMNDSQAQCQPGEQMQMTIPQQVQQPASQQQAPQSYPNGMQQPQPYWNGMQQPAYGQYYGQPVNPNPKQQPQQQMQQWQQSQPVPQQPQATVVQGCIGNNGREYHSQPTQQTEQFSFDKDDESDREILREDPYAEYLDFPQECRMKDEAQMELVYC